MAFLIIIFCLGCMRSETNVTLPPNTMVVEYEPTEVALFSYAWYNDPRIDDWNRLNPGHFVLTDLGEIESPSQVKSRITGKVYQCYLKKGDVLKIPTYSSESSDPRYKFWIPREER